MTCGIHRKGDGQVTGPSKPDMHPSRATCGIRRRPRPCRHTVERSTYACYTVPAQLPGTARRTGTARTSCRSFSAGPAHAELGNVISRARWAKSVCMRACHVHVHALMYSGRSKKTRTLTQIANGKARQETRRARPSKPCTAPSVSSAFDPYLSSLVGETVRGGCLLDRYSPSPTPGQCTYVRKCAGRQAQVGQEQAVPFLPP